MKPSEELETEIIEFIFSTACDDHKSCLELWEKNPWEAVSLYELAHYPEHIGLSVILPDSVVLPDDVKKRLSEEELHAMGGNPVVLTVPRASEMTLEFKEGIGYVNKFGRLINERELFDDDPPL